MENTEPVDFYKSQLSEIPEASFQVETKSPTKLVLRSDDKTLPLLTILDIQLVRGFIQLEGLFPSFDSIETQLKKFLQLNSDLEGYLALRDIEDRIYLVLRKQRATNQVYRMTPMAFHRTLNSFLNSYRKVLSLISKSDLFSKGIFENKDTSKEECSANKQTGMKTQALGFKSDNN